MINELFMSVVYLSFMGSLTAIVIMLLKLLFKNKFSGTWHYYIWIIVLIRLILPFSFNSNISMFNYINLGIDNKFTTHISRSFEDNINTAINNNLNNNWVTKPGTSENNLTIPDKVTQTSNYNNTNTTNYFEEVSNKLHLPLLWMLGILFTSMYIFSSYIIFSIKISRDKLLKSGEILTTLSNCKEQLGIRRNVSIIYTKHITTPCIFGVLSPKILVPNNLLDNLTSKDIEHILLHELSHLKRNDLILNWLMTLVQIIHWFNPIVWFAFSKARQDCELCCDSLVLSKIPAKYHRDYGETLLTLASSYSKSKWTPGISSIISKREIKRRIIMISRFKKQGIAWSVIALSLTLLVSCSNLTNPKSDDTKPNNQTSISDNTNTNTNTNSNDTNTQNDNNQNASDDENQVTNNSTQSSDDNSSTPAPSQVSQSTASSKSIEVLKNVYASAKEGTIPDCEFKSGSNLIDDVIAKWGKPDKIDTAGSGQYAVYGNKGIHFGFNKGDKLFDVRSFNSYLHDVKYNDVQKVLGKPYVINKTSTEHIMIYNVNKTYQLMLVFPKPTNSNSNPSLDHISVFSPSDAKNNMAG